MIALWLALAFLFAVLVYVLLYPFTIRINSIQDRYSFSITPVIQMDLIMGDGSPLLLLRVCMIPFRIRLRKGTHPGMLFSGLTGREEKKDSTGRKKKDAGKRIRAIYLFCCGLIRSFRLKRLVLTFDTGNYPLNARLVPVLTMFHGSKTDISINFLDQNYVDIQIQSRLVHILWHGILLYLRVRRAGIKH